MRILTHIKLLLIFPSLLHINPLTTPLLLMQQLHRMMHLLPLSLLHTKPRPIMRHPLTPRHISRCPSVTLNTKIIIRKGFNFTIKFIKSWRCSQNMSTFRIEGKLEILKDVHNGPCPQQSIYRISSLCTSEFIHGFIVYIRIYPWIKK